jgi:hypothetical protein
MKIRRWRIFSFGQDLRYRCHAQSRRVRHVGTQQHLQVPGSIGGRYIGN